MTTAVPENGHTVLVIDDDETSQDLARLTLGRLGFTDVVMACDGIAGLRALSRMPKPPEFVICDIYMPEQDGLEFLGELAKRAYTGGVILVSSADAPMLAIAREIAMGSGLNLLGAITKPLTQDKLHKALSGPAMTHR